MFVKAPEGYDNYLRFIFDPEHIHENMEDKYAVCGSVVVPKGIKNEIDEFFSEVLGLPEDTPLDVPLEAIYGDNMHTFVEHSHFLNREEGKKCPDYCLCKFERVDYWGHNLYHRLLDKVAGRFGLSKRKLVDRYSEYQREAGQYIARYDWSRNENLANGLKVEGGYEISPMEFILLAILDHPESHSNFGGIGSLPSIASDSAKEVLLDEHAFDECRRGNHEYSLLANFNKKDGQADLVWSSKSQIHGELDSLTFSPRIQVEGMKVGTFAMLSKPPGGLEGPMAEIFRVFCKCSARKTTAPAESLEYIYELWKYKKPPGPVIFSKSITERGQCVARSASIQEKSDEELLTDLFSSYFEEVLPKAEAQVRVAAKLKASRVLKERTNLSSKERHSKVLLKRNLEKMSKVYKYWADLEELLEK